MFALWPYAASALAGLRRRRPRMEGYRRHALAIAAALTGLDDVGVVPDPPRTSMMHLYLCTFADELRSRIARIAAEQRIWAWQRSFSCGQAAWRAVELTVGDATLDFDPAKVRAIVSQLVGHRPAGT